MPIRPPAPAPSVPALLAACLAAAFAVVAPAQAADTYRIGNRVLVEGDSVARLRQVAGVPDRIVTLENRFGAAVGERWEYDWPDGQLVAFILRGGRIVAIQTLR